MNDFYNAPAEPNHEFAEWLAGSRPTGAVGKHFLMRMPVPEFDGIRYGDRFEMIYGKAVCGIARGSFARQALDPAKCYGLHDRETGTVYRKASGTESLYGFEGDRWWFVDSDIANQAPLIADLELLIKPKLEEMMRDPERAAEAKAAAGPLKEATEEQTVAELESSYLERGGFEREPYRWSKLTGDCPYLNALMDFLMDPEATADEMAAEYWESHLASIGEGILLEEKWHADVLRYRAGIEERLRERRSLIEALGRSDAKTVKLVFSDADGDVELAAKRSDLVRMLTMLASARLDTFYIKGNVPESLKETVECDGVVRTVGYVDMTKLAAVKSRGRRIWERRRG